MENLVNQSTLQSYYHNKKVFVTGHTGFKGSWLMACLSQLGAIAKGYALEPEHEECLFNQLLPLNLFENTIADIRKKDKLEEAVISFQPDYIFHLAAQPLVRRSYEIPAETFEVNVVGTANLLEVVKKLQKKCTVVVITTDKVYENQERDILYSETDILGGYDPYSASKACTEIAVNSFRNSFFNIQAIAKHKKGIASARAGNVIGGGDFSDDRIIPDIIKALRNHKVIEVRNPHAVRPWQHVLEPVSGYLLLGGLLNEATEKYSGAYNFGPMPNDHLIVSDLVDIAIKAWGSGDLPAGQAGWKDTSDANAVHEATLLKLDIGKAIEKLGWQPKLNAIKAIEWTIEWYKQKSDIAAFTFKQVNDYMNL